jgi:Putative papain-like cysteine peptidase (DUF1796)
MILPLGDSCHVSRALISLNLRNVSYPFDWCLSTLESSSKLLLQILEMEEDEIRIFLKDFFCIEKNEIGPNNSFINTQYAIGFPHDNADTIYDVYLRRFLRLRQNFFSSDKVIIVYISRYYDFDNLCNSDNTYDSENSLLSLYNNLSKFRDKIYIYAVNIVKRIKDYENNEFIKCIDLHYPCEFIHNSWPADKSIYDHSIYLQNIEDLIRDDLSFFES